MSLIHDSLRKLETKQVKNVGSGFSSPGGSYSHNKNSSAKKLWIAISIVVGLLLVFYAYTLLNKYEKQNESLLHDLNEIKSNRMVINDKNVKSIESSPKTFKKVIVQPPLTIKKSPEVPMVASQERQKEVTELNNRLLNSSSEMVPANSRKKTANPIQVKTNSVNLNENLAENTVNIVQSKPVKKIQKKKIQNKKLSVKDTRQLVNNLQMQMELKNQQEVTRLLNQLAQSSGEESLVYLRMKAYWSNINEDNTMAVLMYKKILYQKPYDIQAGTNLALIEAKMDLKPQALKRLELLRNKYPSNKSVLDYFNKIEGN